MMSHSLLVCGILHFMVQFPTSFTSCTTGKGEECKTASFVPGHNLVGEGFDIVKFTRKGAYVVDTLRWRRRDGTCTLCTNSLLEEKVQKLPLSVVDWRVQTECKRKLSSSVYETSSALMESSTSSVSNDWSTGLEITPDPQISTKLIMAGTHSKLAEFSREKSKQDKYSFASHEIFCKYYRFRVQGEPPRSKSFNRFLKGLPKQYNRESRALYRQVIDIYGTHYIRDVSLGGKIRDVTAIRSCEASMDGITADELKDCLEIEAGASVGDTAKVDAKYQTCEELKKKRNLKGSFHNTFNERESEIVGGDVSNSLDILFSDSQDASIFNKWTESLKVTPDIVSYALEPIHLLARKSQRENLKRAVEEYILEKALWKNCSNTCPEGSQPSRRDSCLCACHEGNGVNSMCCSTKRGAAKLAVIIQKANGLWGDYFTQTDAYVKLTYETHFFQTPVVPNNDNPVWDVTFDVGFITATEHTVIQIEVWDKDNKHDDKLGSCNQKIISGVHKGICYLNHGSLTFEYKLVCGPHLSGNICHNYIAFPN
ncbi:perforin-1-like [Protopterus annectens]|uniref:perforin-1-like n=1 Tax=Protopterus annectens TaxID=7888 RepID=UPI001CFAC7BE|nr:perforin-1-like [Protopterus annectens]XP_043942305.1 perforin-1-like [Protopterus annectens]XP_043942306.1 perforin-1-like [Protopterus annectens]XP_043942307.1 perforin-1-like [Protopterus annectens]